MEFHEYANIFPMLDDFTELANDISNNGLQNPIVVYQGKILDGRNRYKACLDAAVEPDFVQYEGDDPLGYVISLNLHRRHLDTSQRAMVAARLAGLRRGDNQHVGIPTPSQSEAADLLNVSRDSVIQARKVVEKGVPELVEAVTQGQISVHEAKDIASEEPEVQREILERRPFVANNTGNNEWYTPPEYIEAAKAVMGSIDLDPASCEVANRIVGASKFYSIDDDGLTKEWSGNVWMNPPYAAGLVDKFITKLVSHVRYDEVEQAIVLVNNATETKWFQEMLEECSAVCFVKSRIAFLNPEGEGGKPLQGQAALYFGNNRVKFHETFRKFGVVLSG